MMVMMIALVVNVNDVVVVVVSLMASKVGEKEKRKE